MSVCPSHCEKADCQIDSKLCRCVADDLRTCMHTFLAVPKHETLGIDNTLVCGWRWNCIRYGIQSDGRTSRNGTVLVQRNSRRNFPQIRSSNNHVFMYFVICSNFQNDLLSRVFTITGVQIHKGFNVSVVHVIWWAHWVQILALQSLSGDATAWKKKKKKESVDYFEIEKRWRKSDYKLDKHFISQHFITEPQAQ